MTKLWDFKKRGLIRNQGFHILSSWWIIIHHGVNYSCGQNVNFRASSYIILLMKILRKTMNKNEEVSNLDEYIHTSFRRLNLL